MATLYAGTSGFAYPKWKPEFYPKKVPQKDFLRYYATRLNAVEVNYTFRQLPKAATLEKWVEQTTPEEASAGATEHPFVFVLKAHQRITHFNRLKESEFTDLFFRAIDPLRSARRLGPVLFQLPPNLKLDVELLTSFVDKLPNEVRCAFEFRHESWLCDAVYDLFAKYRIALCLAESEKFVVPEVLTADFVYVRLRKEDYSAGDRAEIADRVRGMLAGGRDVYCFFKHEDTPDGALYAEELLREVG